MKAIRTTSYGEIKRSEEHTSELQSPCNLVCRLLLEKKKTSAVLLMTATPTRQEGRAPLAFIEAMEYAALHPSEGLLMAPAIAVPRLLDLVGLRLTDIDLIEIHEAFAAQVLANAAAGEKGWKGLATDPVNWDRVNVNGSSISVGHPWSATGGRILTTLAYEMARRNARYGLISMCAAGAMAGAFPFHR